MGGVLYRASTQWRRRLRAQLVLVLLIATTGAIAMTTFAGARRTASVTDRFTEATGTPDVFADLRMTDFEGADAIAELPQVVEVGRIASFASFPQNGEYTPLLTSADGKVGKTIDRGILVAGTRPHHWRPHPARVDVDRTDGRMHDRRGGLRGRNARAGRSRDDSRRRGNRPAGDRHRGRR